MVTHSTAQARRGRQAFKAIADPTRRAILDRLEQGAASAGELARLFPISRPAISKHLRVLRHARLVKESRTGRHRMYVMNPQPLAMVDQWLNRYRAHWTARLMDLKDFVESQPDTKEHPRDNTRNIHDL